LVKPCQQSVRYCVHVWTILIQNSMDFELEYAKSGRAACKVCKGKIENKALRIGAKARAATDEDADASSRQEKHMMESVKWHHFQCFPKLRKPKWFQEHLPSPEECVGFDALTPEDQEKIKALFSLCKGEDAVLPADMETPQKQEQEAKGGRKRKANEEPVLTAAQKLAKLSDTGRGAFTEKQYADFQQHKAELSKKNATQLGAMLAKNGMAKSGKKDDLVERVAECKVLGALPLYPTCEKGRLKWQRESGLYTCPGYFDDEQSRMVRCKGPQKDVEIVRLTWEELTF